MPDSSPFSVFFNKCRLRLKRWLVAMSLNRRFRRGYLAGSVGVLLISSIYWSIMGAHVQVNNADQLVDPYLFTHWQTFHQAVFPSAHSFLLKWPIFWVVSLVGVSATSLAVATVGTVLVTVAVLAFVVSRIERRPLVLGTILLGLAAAMMLVPAQPYAGGILPVNMAMLTTRNLEYAVYLVALALLARAVRLRSYMGLAAFLLLTLLFASDRLFVSLSVGGAALLVILYAAVRNWPLVTFAIRWLIVSVAATVGSAVVLGGMSLARITSFGGSTSSPYALAAGLKDTVLGGVYAVLSLFTDVGANPAYDNRLLSQLPKQLLERTVSVAGLAYVITAASLVYALVITVRFVRPTVWALPRRLVMPPAANRLGLTLIASSVTAVGSFIVTNHYYAVDARYVAIIVFALPVVMAATARKLKWKKPEYLLVVGGIFVISLLIGGVVTRHTAAQQSMALDGMDLRNQSVAQALKHHKVSVLVGDYWRVLPIKLASKGTQTVLPLEGCTQPTPTLTSAAWQPDLQSHSFAYLLTFDGSLTNYPNCDLATVTKAYGRPNASETIAGTLAHPKELLLFYDHGRNANPAAPQHTTTTLLPINLDQLNGVTCSGPTIITVVAHQDDDLLFTSPDLLHDIQAGHCMRTIYLTAGDSGQDKFYWLGRQLGAEAAYSQMLGDKSGWIQQTVRLGNQEYVTVASPSDNTKISLLFFNLPDGNLQGQGFASSANQSLAKLLAGSLPVMTTVDEQSKYTLGQLESGLATLLGLYQPSEVRSQADVASAVYPDHSDHIATGHIAQAATDLYDQSKFEGKLSIPFIQYIGYPTHGYAANVSGSDLAEKEAAFLAYAQYDGGVCHGLEQCLNTPTYGSYISRQYVQDSP